MLYMYIVLVSRGTDSIAVVLEAYVYTVWCLQFIYTNVGRRKLCRRRMTSRVIID